MLFQRTSPNLYALQSLHKETYTRSPSPPTLYLSLEPQSVSCLKTAGPANVGLATNGFSTGSVDSAVLNPETLRESSVMLHNTADNHCKYHCFTHIHAMNVQERYFPPPPPRPQPQEAFVRAASRLHLGHLDSSSPFLSLPSPYLPAASYGRNELIVNLLSIHHSCGPLGRARPRS